MPDTSARRVVKILLRQIKEMEAYVDTLDTEGAPAYDKGFKAGCMFILGRLRQALYEALD